MNANQQIKPYEFEQRIMAQLRKRSRLDAHRAYLGMSQIGRCQAQIYRTMTLGSDTGDFNHRMAYTGYMHEWDVLTRLREMGLAQLDRRELVADFDERLRGHVDGVTTWGDLLEIKSTSAHKFEMVVYHNRAMHEHNDQAQLYMLYGGWRDTYFVYVNRETFEHKVMRVSFDQERAALLVEKAKRVLAAVDAGEPPACECGRCDRRDK